MNVVWTHFSKTVKRQCVGALPWVVVVCATAALPQAEDATETLQGQYYDFLNGGQYELARKLAIVQFRPDFHCEVYLHESAAILSDVERQLDRLEAGEETGDANTLNALRVRLGDARALGERAQTTAQDYVDAGLDVELGARVRKLRADIQEPLLPLEQRLEGLLSRAKPFAALLQQADISRRDIGNLEPPERLLVGLHLADRGRFQDAIDMCFVPLQLEGDGALQYAAEAATSMLQRWHEPARDNRKWTNLVDGALDACDQLRAAFPQRPELAGWMLALGAHLARDHYDVGSATIRGVLKTFDDLSALDGDNLDTALLRAKLEHERFLLLRRNEQWGARAPAVEHIALFQRAHTLWYAAEASLIAAASDAERHAARADEAAAWIMELDRTNPALSAALGKRLQRYQALQQPFERWLEIAKQPDYRDRRGTVLPDVLLETRSDLVRRVRAGFEALIAERIMAQAYDDAFQLVQQAKALSVGRTLSTDVQAEPEPISSAALLRTQLLSEGLSQDKRIAEKELFIEYFFGPQHAWAFYLFAPGDQFQELLVVELDRPAFEAACRAAIAALQAGEQPQPAGPWLLSGSPDLALLWNQMEPIKKRLSSMPRLVVAPDGPLCFLPLNALGLNVAASVTTLPTAAVLQNARYMDARTDAWLLWESQRGDLAPALVRPKRSEDGGHLLVLWPGQELEIVLRDE